MIILSVILYICVYWNCVLPMTGLNAKFCSKLCMRIEKDFSILFRENMEKIMENTILHSNFKNLVMKSIQCVYCALIIKIILNYYYGLSIKIYKRIAANYLKYLSPSKGLCVRVHWYNGTMVHCGNAHWYIGTMNIACLHYCSCSIVHLANIVC